MSSSSNETEKNSKPPEPEGAEPSLTECQEPRLVPDDSEEYEEQQTGIELSYVLKEREVYECLKYSGRLRKNRKASLLTSGALAAGAVAFLAAGAFTYRGACWFFSVLCAALLTVLNIFPYRRNKERARADADGGRVRVTVYPDRVEVEKKTGRREIPMDGTAWMAQIRNMFVLYPPWEEKAGKNSGPDLLILPKRCINPRILPDVQAIIVAGTRPKKTTEP